MVVIIYWLTSYKILREEVEAVVAFHIKLRNEVQTCYVGIDNDVNRNRYTVTTAVYSPHASIGPGRYYVILDIGDPRFLKLSFCIDYGVGFQAIKILVTYWLASCIFRIL